MARKVLIQIRRGLEKDIGTLAEGELGYCTDTKKLYVGTVAGNVLLVAAQTVGDMLKSIYDTNNDGVVDAAASVPWSGVTGKPSTFPPSAHIHNSIPVIDVRTLSANDTNHDPLPNSLVQELKSFFSMAYPGGSWRSALTIKGWTGDYAVWQLIGPASTSADDNFYLRSGIGSSWREARKIWHDGNDGAGSGLDADLLDGKHASEFAPVSHNHAIANVTGLQTALDGKMKKGALTWNDLKGV